MSKSACFTGHRPQDLNGFNPQDNVEMLVKLRETIIDHIENKDVTTFISGMALGVDQWAARLVNKLKGTYPHIKLVAAVPCDKQYEAWKRNPQAIKEWHEIIDYCDEVVYVSNEPYTNWCMQKRNEWMVDNSHYVIAVWSGKEYGGTWNCIKYAKKKDIEITHVNPYTLEVSELK